jgi:hypothetical protein
MGLLYLLYMQTGQLSPSKADIKGAPQLPVLNANRPFFFFGVTIPTVMFICTELVGIVVMAEYNS